MKSVYLRQAVAADWPTIALLLEANKLPMAGARENIDRFVLALNDNRVVGCAGAEHYGDFALLRSVAIAPDMQRQGIGKQLVERMLAECRRQGFKAIYLLTTTAYDYFPALGFAVVNRALVPQALKQSAEFQGACPSSAILMIKKLQEYEVNDLDIHPVAILGAGPVGLAAAAQLIERQTPFLILETANRVGANLLDYGHVRLFSPWRYDIDPAMARLLEPTGWQALLAPV